MIWVKGLFRIFFLKKKKSFDSRLLFCHTVGETLSNWRESIRCINLPNSCCGSLCVRSKTRGAEHGSRLFIQTIWKGLILCSGYMYLNIVIFWDIWKTSVTWKIWRKEKLCLDGGVTSHSTRRACVVTLSLSWFC